MLRDWVAVLGRIRRNGRRRRSGMTRRRYVGPTAATVDVLEDRCLLAAVSWDGGAGTLNWADALNWSADAIPAAGDDITINQPSSTILFSGPSITLGSLTTTSLTVQSGTLTVSGALNVSAGSTLRASGATSSMSAPGSVNVDGVSLISEIAGTISLPGLVSYNGNGVYPVLRA
ncbi:MAG: hypothetical protein KDA89_18795, partial [Planctomycetaceae bacterium]|nr:hypothetical protein [Planctomycetaceae bacterium]